MAKRYIRVNWQNRPSVATPISATNLNKMDKGIDDIDNAIEEIYNKRVNNVVTTNPDTFLAGPVGKTLQDQITTLNNNLTHKTTYKTYSVDSGTSLAIALRQGGVYLVTTTFNGIDAVNTSVLAFGGLANNSTLPTRYNILKAGADIAYTVGNSAGTYNQLNIENTSTHTINVSVVSLNGLDIV